MKTLFTLSLFLTTTLSALAGWKGDDRAYAPTRTQVWSLRHTCAAVQGSVRQNGAVILFYGGREPERVVRDAGYCSRASGETTVPFWAPSADNRQCFTGYRCVDRSNRR